MTETRNASVDTDSDSLARLLAIASAAIGNNSDVAKECIQRATFLLQAGSAAGSPEPLRPVVKGGLANWQTRRVALHIDRHLGGRIQASDLAALTQLSTSHFFRAFRETFGETPLAYISRCRMRRAQELMLSSREPLSQIALDCGMCDQAHFTRVFRKVVGMNPSAWRRQFRAEPRSSCGP